MFRSGLLHEPSTKDTYGARVQDVLELINSFILTAPGHIMKVVTSREQYRDGLTSRGEWNIDEISAKSKESRC